MHSTLPDLGLPPWRGPADAAVDITLSPGTVDAPTPGLHVRPDGAATLVVPQVARYLISGGCHITVEAPIPPSGPEWRLHLLGTALTVLWYQRGLYPLHAACVVVNGQTIALAGAAGAGKSTLALRLRQHGHLLLSDDCTLVQNDDAGTLIRPAFPRLKLWADSLAALGAPLEGAELVRPGLDKYDLRPQEDLPPHPRRLDAIYLLVREDQPPTRDRLPAVQAAPLLHQHFTRVHVAGQLGRQASLFAAAARIAATVPVFRLIRAFDFARIDDVIRVLEDRVQK